SLQVVLPGTRSQVGEWEGEEEDANGTCFVRYQREPDQGQAKGTRRFLKTRVSYQQQQREETADGFTTPLMTEPAGELMVHFDVRNGCLLSVEGTEATRLRMNDRDVGQTRTTMTVTLRRRQTMAGADLAALETEATVRSSFPGIPLKAGP